MAAVPLALVHNAKGAVSESLAQVVASPSGLEDQRKIVACLRFLHRIRVVEAISQIISKLLPCTACTKCTGRPPFCRAALLTAKLGEPFLLQWRKLQILRKNFPLLLHLILELGSHLTTPCNSTLKVMRKLQESEPGLQPFEVTVDARCGLHRRISKVRPTCYAAGRRLWVEAAAILEHCHTLFLKSSNCLAHLQQAHSLLRSVLHALLSAWPAGPQRPALGLPPEHGSTNMVNPD
mmetsp:Transcript_54845/g.127681  ORF Transcript_54845/g.127681 Transcript_54845/m.127681 type:complete len:236 (+) Transcript_54845:500-1207(+)